MEKYTYRSLTQDPPVEVPYFMEYYLGLKVNKSKR